MELQVNQHMQATTYCDLAADFHFLGSLRQFNSSFLFSGKDVFSVIASSVAAMTNDITDKIRFDWQQYHGQFMSMIKIIGPQLNTAALEKLKVNLVGLIEKLKVLTLTMHKSVDYN